MSITIKKKTTRTFLASLDNRAQNTKKCFAVTVQKFTKFVKETQNITPDQFCEELVIMKKQDEEKYTDTLYSILQDFIDNMSKEMSGNTVKCYFSYLRGSCIILGLEQTNKTSR